MRYAIVFMVAATTLAGCSESEGLDGTAQFEFAIDADAPQDVDIAVSGAWLQEAGNGTWIRIVAAGTAFELGGGMNSTTAAVPAGPYERIRVVMANVTVDGQPAALAESGFELPLNLSLAPEQATRLTVAFAWTESISGPPGNPSFQPTLSSIEVSREGKTLVRLEAAALQTTATKSPVARMEVFDAEALRVFQTDFVAESPSRYILGVGPNITFQAAASEAVQAGATLETYEWSFGDAGATGDGPTVSHAYPLSGGKFTVRLTVTDSHGVADSQVVKLALAPGKTVAKERFSGTVTGLYPSSCDTSGNGDGMTTHTLPIDAAQAPDGTAADLIRVQVNLFAQGNPHAGADIDLRVLNGGGQSMGTGSSDGTSEEVSREFEPGTAENGDWTIQVKPCLAYAVDYDVVASLTWLAKEPEAGYLEWWNDYDDGHDHQH